MSLLPLLLNRNRSNRPTLNLEFTSNPVPASVTFTRATTATYVNSAGSIASAAIDTPRIDYDPVTLACKGLLIEEARTNLLTYSEQFDNAAWGKSSTTVVANAATAPDGALTADRLTKTASAFAELHQSVTSAIGAYSFSFFVKADTSNIASIALTDSGSIVVRSSINLTTGVVTNYSGTATSKNAGNGWWRITASGSTTTTTTIGCYGYPDIYDSANAGSVYIWGADLQAGSFATSYIPTVGSQVTRAADVAVMTGSNFSSWYRQDEGTFVVEWDVYAPTTSGFDRVFDANDGSLNNGIAVVKNNGTGVYYSASTVATVNQMALVTTAVTANVFVKDAFCYKLNDFAQSFNGAAVTTDAAGTIPALNRLDIGNVLATSQLNGHIKRLTYYPTRLPNATLVALSA